ncbi:DUF4272 domain-containing protein [Flavobacterium sp. WLB]|uniref:DUF4272 domain-containing protein n=1 Tax=unclassified Flavobacterium TaxID=196869 RepID=UPI0006ABE610|nr:MULTISPECIES: DUF4272 domain-containing protein [unclassified Flavobacterium]KOP38204.1 hypothetical protein AKO67_10215 [Flavobacterium sp. VMW]OWU92299.1 hypothetical protein APR43_03420 [Flavobacterium sp. NLM]PUU70799.1 DUF4272 domain-containing protein [Flavobacterium sp. WLB]
MICTIYSHHLGIQKIKEIFLSHVPKGTFSATSEFLDFEIKGGILSPSKTIRISYRQRAVPSYKIPELDDSDLTANLKGLYGFVNSLPTVNEKVKGLFLHKIQTLNSEFSISQEKGEVKELKAILAEIAKEFDAIVFVEPDAIISKSDSQHFLDKNLNLIIDTNGNCEIDDLGVSINSEYFDDDQSQLDEDQIARKEKSEKILEKENIKINIHLPCIESESETTLRTPKEIAERVSVLAITNLVAFNTISAEEAVEYLQHNKLWDFTTDGEKEFLADPTEDRKMYETWKCEGIWTLMWALNKVENLDFPSEFCNLENINSDDYPVGKDKDLFDFINSINSTRTKSEILDAADLYYRYNWACVDARINGKQIEAINPGIVYERQYALNWLINYMDQDWDDVTCDT